MLRDRWIALWELLDDGMRIYPTDDPSIIILEFEGGERSEMRYHDDHGWVFPEEHNACPGDIAARDTL